MNVGFLCSEYPSLCPDHGGIGSFTQTLARKLVGNGHKATVYAFTDRDAVLDDGGVEVIAVSREGGILKATTKMRKRIRDDLKSGRIDVIESPECESHCLPGGKGTIVRMHGSHHFWCRTLLQKRRLSRLLLEQLGIRSAHRLCAVSRYTAEVTRLAMHLAKRPIEILYNPVDTDRLIPSPESVVKNRIVFVGSIVRKKGIMELCLSMAHVVKRYPDAELIVAGRDCPAPDGSPSFRRVIEGVLDAEPRRHIEFLGHVAHREIKDLMASAHVCVFPSHMETQGLVVAEAMACGRPVLVSDRGPGPEVLGTDGECGLLIDPEDPEDISEKICAVLSGRENAGLMGARGRLRAEGVFSLSACLEKTLQFYGDAARR